MDHSRLIAAEERRSLPTASLRSGCGKLQGLGENTNGFIRLLSDPVRSPANSAEEFAASLISEQAALSYHELVARLADYLYRQEMDAGAWVVDIGLFGSTLFDGDAMRVWEAGRGELWEIG